MLQKCANPICDTQFKYLHQGKLFEVETQYLDCSASAPERNPRNGKGQVELYWVCERCAAQYVLSFDRQEGEMTLRSHADSNNIAVWVLPQAKGRNVREIIRVLIRPFDQNSTTRRGTREAA